MLFAVPLFVVFTVWTVFRARSAGRSPVGWAAAVWLLPAAVGAVVVVGGAVLLPVLSGRSMSNHALAEALTQPLMVGVFGAAGVVIWAAGRSRPAIPPPGGPGGADPAVAAERAKAAADRHHELVGYAAMGGVVLLIALVVVAVRAFR